ncbi:hypothetical protein BVY04_05405 [bacterium M21]|nr:hypothetical protein BVY04_05405 [bacterium M21]
MAVMSMRTVVYLQPGEVASCVGCHESQGTAASTSGRGMAKKVQTLTRSKWLYYPVFLCRLHCVTWFKLAQKHVRNKGADLYLNDFQVISDPKSEVISKNVKDYHQRMRFLVDNGAPINRIGFQSRFGTRGQLTPPETIYERLCYFDEFDMPITATEFEIKMEVEREIDKAIQVEHAMTMYFSHPNVEGMFIWTFFENPKPFKPSAADREFVDVNGKPNLRGKVWMYLTNNRWMTNEILGADGSGYAKVRGFKGDY